jgi:hypothetical protein
MNERDRCYFFVLTRTPHEKQINIININKSNRIPYCLIANEPVRTSLPLHRHLILICTRSHINLSIKIQQEVTVFGHELISQNCFQLDCGGVQCARLFLMSRRHNDVYKLKDKERYTLRISKAGTEIGYGISFWHRYNICVRSSMVLRSVRLAYDRGS